MNYIFENDIKINILTDKPLSYQQIAQAVVDLKREISDWIKPDSYRPAIGENSDSAEKHINQLLPLATSLEDLIKILTEHISPNYIPAYVDNARNSLEESLKTIIDFNDETLNPFLKQLKILYNLVTDIQSQWPNVLPIPEGDQLFKSFENRLMQFKSNPERKEELLKHPALSLCDQKLVSFSSLRESIRTNKQDFRSVFIFDDKFGWSNRYNTHKLPLGVLQNSFVKFHEYHAQNKTASWFHWGVELISEMEKNDADDYTGWRESLISKYNKQSARILTKNMNVSISLRDEVNKIEEIDTVEQKAKESIAPSLPTEYHEFVLKAEYEQALLLYLRWLGVLPNLNNSFEEIQPVMDTLHRLDSWGKLSSSLPEIGDIPETLFDWLRKMATIVNAVEIPPASASRWRRERYFALEPFKQVCIGEIASAATILKNLVDNQIEWNIRYQELINVEGEFFELSMSPLPRFITSKKETALKAKVIKKLCECKKIAPHHPDIVSKMEQYGNPCPA